MSKDLNDFKKDLQDFSKAFSNLEKASDNKILIEKGEVIDTSLSVDSDKLSSNVDSAIKESEYVKKRKKGKVSLKGVSRFIRDFISQKSNGVFKPSIDD